MDSRAAGEMLKDRFPAAVLAVEEFRGETTVTIDSGALREVMRFLKEDEAARYDLLVDLAGADFGAHRPGSWSPISCTPCGTTTGSGSKSGWRKAPASTR